MNENKLDGAVVVIVGASSGLGRAAAQAFARRRARLVLAARREAALKEVAAECERIGAPALAVRTDVTSADQVRQLAERANAFGGRIDVWINNVGVGAVGEFTETPVEAHDQVIRASLVGHFYGAHAVLPYFKRQKAGVMINTNSLGAWMPTPFAAAYTASKFGLLGLSQSLRAELSRWPGIHICDVFPTFLDTPGIQHGANYTGKRLRPMPPVHDPRKIAEAMVRLAEQPRKWLMFGSLTRLGRIGQFMAPNLMAWIGAQTMKAYLRKASNAPRTDGNLFEPQDPSMSISGGWRGQTQIPMTAIVGAAIVAGAALGAVVASRR